VRHSVIKQAPGIGRLVAMALFTLSVFGLLIFLWIAFGGAIPLSPKGYRFTVHMPEAASLAEQADVRMAGVNVGKVKSKGLDENAARTVVEIELDDAYAPLPREARAILRQTTLLGDTYV
jgi:phospholipid/cholesterol/gamma-HCH transport system substrate-binding protein